MLRPRRAGLNPLNYFGCCGWSLYDRPNDMVLESVYYKRADMRPWFIMLEMLMIVEPSRIIKNLRAIGAGICRLPGVLGIYMPVTITYCSRAGKICLANSTILMFPSAFKDSVSPILRGLLSRLNTVG